MDYVSACIKIFGRRLFSVILFYLLLLLHTCLEGRRAAIFNIYLAGFVLDGHRIGSGLLYEKIISINRLARFLKVSCTVKAENMAARRRRRKSGQTAHKPSGILKPRLPFVLVLVGAVVILLAGVATLSYAFVSGKVVATFFVAKYNIGIPINMVYRAILASGTIGVLSGIVLIGVSLNMNSKMRGKVVASAIIGLVFSLLSLLNGGGFYLAFVLAFTGSILAIIYRG